MARISTYKNDENVSLNDKLLGTDKDSGLKPTRNYTIKDIRDLILDGVDVKSQDNVPVSITLPQILEPSLISNVLVDASDLINSADTFSINSVQIPFFNLRRGSRIFVLAFQGLGKGEYGLGTEPISPSNLQIISEKNLNLENIENSSTTTTINLFNIGSSEINEIVNVLEPPIEIKPISQGFTVFLATQNGVKKSWLYSGDSGTFGLNNSQTSVSDFQELNISDSLIPTFQQVVDASGDGFIQVEFPTGTYIEDDGGSFTIELGNSFFRINSNGSLELDAQQLILKGSNASLVGRALVVQADGSVDWENITVDLSNYYTKTEIDNIISTLPVGYTSQDFDNDFASKTTDDLQEGTAKFISQGELDKLGGIEENAQVNQTPVTEPPQLVNGVVQVDLSNPMGIYSDATVTTTEQFEVIAGAVTGGIHVFRVNLPTDPDASITGATKYVSSEFIENVDLLLVFEQFNFGTKYYFLEI